MASTHQSPTELHQQTQTSHHPSEGWRYEAHMDGQWLVQYRTDSTTSCSKGQRPTSERGWRSTRAVFRTNVPPCFPFFSNVNPNVIPLLDCKSFSHLFDKEIIDKKDILARDFMPSVSYTGNQRVCIYLDTSEENNGKVLALRFDFYP
ncbi:hypothetical protein Droror1_Dr00003028 [Drosera rotundifolia]